MGVFLQSLHSSVLLSPSFTHQSTPNATEIPYLAVGNSEMEAGSDLAFNELQAWCAERRLTGRQVMNDAGVP